MNRVPGSVASDTALHRTGTKKQDSEIRHFGVAEPLSLLDFKRYSLFGSPVRAPDLSRLHCT